MKKKRTQRTHASWTADETIYLVENLEVSNEILAKNLNRTIHSIASKKYDLKGAGLKNSGKPFSKNEIEWMKTNYHKSNAELVGILRRRPKEINRLRYMVKHDQQQPSCKSTNRKVTAKDLVSNKTIIKPKVSKSRINEVLVTDLDKAANKFAELILSLDKGKYPVFVLRQGKFLAILNDGDPELNWAVKNNKIEKKDKLFKVVPLIN